MFGPLDKELKLRNRKLRAQTLVILGAGFGFVAYLIFYKSSQFAFRQNGQVVTYYRVDYPIAFNVAAAVVLLSGACAFVYGVLLLAGKTATGKEVIPAGGYSVGWGVFNAAVLALFIWLGYVGIPLEILRGVEPLWVICISAFVVMALSTFAQPHFAEVSMFRKPQWGRCPLKWWRDPLQVPFVGTFWWAGLLLGTILHLFISHLTTDSTAVWNVMVYVSILAGLLVGQVLIYAAYRNRIES